MTKMREELSFLVGRTLQLLGALLYFAVNFAVWALFLWLPLGLSCWDRVTSGIPFLRALWMEYRVWTGFCLWEAGREVRDRLRELWERRR